MYVPLDSIVANKAVADQHKSMQWSSEADEMLCRISSKQRRQVTRDVEKAVKASRGTEVR